MPTEPQMIQQPNTASWQQAAGRDELLPSSASAQAKPNWANLALFLQSPTPTRESLFSSSLSRPWLVADGYLA